MLVFFAHYAATWAALLYGLELSSARFDHGGAPTASERTVRAVYSTLSAPVMPLFMRSPARRWLPGLWGHVPLLLNSALWAGTAMWLVRRIARRSESSSRLAS